MMALLFGFWVGVVSHIKDYNCGPVRGKNVRFNVDVSDQLITQARTSHCDREYESRYNRFEEVECELESVRPQYDRGFIGEFSCTCWEMK